MPPSPSDSSFDVAEFAPFTGGANLASFLDSVKGIRDLSPLRAVALYSIAHYIARASVKGEVVNCGYGRTATLVAMAAAFVQIGDTSRRLVLLGNQSQPHNNRPAVLDHERAEARRSYRSRLRSSGASDGLQPIGQALVTASSQRIPGPPPFGVFGPCF
jgi:hypothetical protein